MDLMAGDTLDIDGRTIAVTNLAKVLYPLVPPDVAGTRKFEVIDYYNRIADVLLPHVRGRIITRKRWPGGVGSAAFFEKHLPEGAPAWLPRYTVEHSQRSITYAMADDRAALVVDSVQSARDALSDLTENRLRPGVLRGEHTNRPTTAWLFTGQGSQFPGMARELFDSEPVFAETVRQCADAVADIVERPLLDVLFGTDRDTGDDGKSLRHTSYAQPALFAVEMGLARLWQSWGIEPDVVLGHSVGQYAAACVAGVLSLEDGARLIAERGRLFGSLPEGGRMVAVFTDPSHVEAIAGDFPHISVAAYNGPNTVLSGPGEDLEPIVARFSEDGIRCTWLETSHAFHSELLEPVLDEFESYAAQLTFNVPTLPLVCNRTGAVLTADTPLDARYWRRHSRNPVQFAESVRTVAALGCTVLMEIGPQPVLTGAAVQVWPEHLAAPRAIVSLRKGVADRRQIADATAAAYVSGLQPDFAALQHHPTHKLELPTYPFQRRRFWPRSAGISLDGPAVSGILGSAKDLASGDSVYTSRDRKSVV